MKKGESGIEQDVVEEVGGGQIVPGLGGYHRVTFWGEGEDLVGFYMTWLTFKEGHYQCPEKNK